jgi:radical SAM superfamily enzyme YgiQ (UPF0313 family)
MIDRKGFNITLLFPPVWLPELPYLSLPALSAYLKQEGYDPVQRDLNVEFWHHFYQTDKLKEIYQWSKDTYFRLRRKDEHLLNNDKGLDFLIELRMMFLEHDGALERNRTLDLKSAPFPSEEEFIEKLTQGRVGKKPFRKLCSAFWQDSRILKKEEIPSSQWESHIKYHDYFFSDISLSQHSLSAKGILQIIDDDKYNPYIQYFKKNVIESIVKKAPHLVGISVIAINQVIPAFTLAKFVKEHFPGVHIVLGGPWCTHLHEVLPQKLSLFKWIDSIVVFEGEQALLKLAERLRLNKDLRAVPNLIYKEGEIAQRNNIIYDQDLNLLPTPDFRGIPLEKYEFVGSLPLQASRGCSWHRCLFCSYPVIEPVYRARNPELVVKDMKTMIEEYGVKTFSFSDSILEPDQFNQISQLIIEAKLQIKWIGFARFDGRLTAETMNRMAAAGCQVLFWGMESGCGRILKLIRKGNTPALIRKILKYSAEAGIHNRVSIMYGFPTERLKDVNTTIQFIEDNIKYIHSLAYNFLTLERNTPLLKNAADLEPGIKKNLDCNLNIGYNHEAMFSKDELKRLENDLWTLTVQVEKYHENKTRN